MKNLIRLLKNWFRQGVIVILIIRELPDIVALFLMRKIGIVLKLISVGQNHQDYNMKNKKYFKDNYNYDDNHICHHNISVHAEEMAINKLRKNKSKKLIKISLLVIRITEGSTIDSYTLSNSKPCIACVHKIKNVTKLGYKIDKIYYSDSNGNILFFKLRELLKQKQHLSNYYKSHPLPKLYLHNSFD